MKSPSSFPLCLLMFLGGAAGHLPGLFSTVSLAVVLRGQGAVVLSAV